MNMDISHLKMREVESLVRNNIRLRILPNLFVERIGNIRLRSV